MSIFYHASFLPECSDTFYPWKNASDTSNNMNETVCKSYKPPRRNKLQIACLYASNRDLTYREKDSEDMIDL